MNATALTTVAALLISATAANLIWIRWKPEAQPLFPAQRVRAWWLMVVVFGLAIAGGPNVSIAGFALLSFFALKEYLHHLPRQLTRGTRLLCYLSIALQYWWVKIDWYGMFVIFIPVFMFLYLPTTNSFAGNNKTEPLSDQAMLHWGMMTTVFCLSHAAYLLVLVPKGAALLLFVCVLTEVSDGVRFLLTRFSWGAKASPLLCLFVALLCALYFGPLITPMSSPHIALAGFVLGLAGVLGNANVTAIARELEMEPGGKLARIESLAATAPLFFHGFRYFYTV